MKLIRQRLDVFILFIHGIPYLDEVLNELRNERIFSILYLRRFQVPDMPAFIDKLYACDHVPAEHLQGKTSFLKTLAPEFYFILVKNNCPDERYYGEGAFRHIQCSRVKEFKNKIRDRFNPRLEDGSRTEQHVIHATDYESQVFHTLDILSLSDPAYFTREPNANFELPYFVQPFGRYQIKTIPFSQLVCRNGQALVSVFDTIHYRYLMGDSQPYLDYFAANRGITDFADHGPAAFDRLYKEFQYSQPRYVLVNPVAESSNAGPQYLLEDGNHRAAIVARSGRKDIECIVKEPFANLLQLREFFEHAAGCRYAVIRRKEYLPWYYAGEDVDLLTDDWERLTAAVLRFANKYNICTALHQAKGHYYADLRFDQDIHFRFDIITALPYTMDDEYRKIILDRCTKIDREGVIIPVPNPVDDLILRYMEYMQHPEKVQHMEYVRQRADQQFFAELVNNTNLDGRGL